MSKLTRSLLFVAIATQFAVTAAQAASFTFSYQIDPTNVVTGSFDGTQNGNLITGISNIDLSYNGVNDSNSLIYGSNFNTQIGNWQTGGAVVSVDGSQNNFLFINSNYPAVTNYTEYFYMVDFGINSGGNHAAGYDSSSGFGFSNPTNLANWQLNGATAAGVPDGGVSVALLGAVLAALAGARRKFGLQG